ncbi:uncharacterized protein LOC129588836 [Paramacrobiotus metropolitanus]|uniref:uncharacterized protein LOC129588836 n=1 Tax=Paramacrobiotus metropolitanus TaxID=2943436 RepID=UPI002445E4BA|nr:uncharacterized protein LOC129588836 [Paramacrobiotus metropolitanus]
MLSSIIAILIATCTWIRSTNGLACQQCSFEDDLQDACRIPWPGGAISRLLQCPDVSGFCQVGIVLIPEINLQTGQIGHVMGRNCGSSRPDVRRDNAALWATRSPGDLIACQEIPLRRVDSSSMFSKRSINLRCVCRHDGCNNQTVTDMLRIRQERQYDEAEVRSEFITRYTNPEPLGDVVTEENAGENTEHEVPPYEGEENPPSIFQRQTAASEQLLAVPNYFFFR